MRLSEMEKSMTAGSAAKPVTPHWIQPLFPLTNFGYIPYSLQDPEC